MIVGIFVCLCVSAIACAVFWYRRKLKKIVREGGIVRIKHSVKPGLEIQEIISEEVQYSVVRVKQLPKVPQINLKMETKGEDSVESDSTICESEGYITSGNAIAKITDYI